MPVYYIVCEFKINPLSLFFFSNSVSTVASGITQGGTAGNGTVGLNLNSVNSNSVSFFYNCPRKSFCVRPLINTRERTRHRGTFILKLLFLQQQKKRVVSVSGQLS